VLQTVTAVPSYPKLRNVEWKDKQNNKIDKKQKDQAGYPTRDLKKRAPLTTKQKLNDLEKWEYADDSSA
jgi:hypothetical protein